MNSHDKVKTCITILNDQNQYMICVKEGLFYEIMYKTAKTIAKMYNPEMTEEQIIQLILPDLKNAGFAEIINN